jgi:hypothetical protein
MANVTKLAEVPGGFQFKISAGPKEFTRAVEAIKKNVPIELRSFDSELKMWFVSNRFKDVLSGIFTNFDKTLDAIRSQGVLF